MTFDHRVGLDLDKDLLSQLAKGGARPVSFRRRRAGHREFFVKEVQSLISPVARRVQLEINYDPSLGWNTLRLRPQHSANRINLKLDDMNQGLTEVVMMRFK